MSDDTKAYYTRLGSAQGGLFTILAYAVMAVYLFTDLLQMISAEKDVYRSNQVVNKFTGEYQETLMSKSNFLPSLEVKLIQPEGDRLPLDFEEQPGKEAQEDILSLNLDKFKNYVEIFINVRIQIEDVSSSILLPFRYCTKEDFEKRRLEVDKLFQS